MKLILKSFLPFALVLAGIVGSVIYLDNLALEQSNAYQEMKIGPAPVSAAELAVQPSNP